MRNVEFHGFLGKKIFLNIIYGILADCTLAEPVTFEERYLRFSLPSPSPPFLF